MSEKQERQTDRQTDRKKESRICFSQYQLKDYTSNNPLCTHRAAAPNVRSVRLSNLVVKTFKLVVKTKQLSKNSVIMQIIVKIVN